MVRILLGWGIRLLLLQGLDPPIPLLGLVTGVLSHGVCPNSERRSQIAAARHEVSMRNGERLGNGFL